MCGGIPSDAVTVKLNTQIRVKLTPEGVETLYDHYSALTRLLTGYSFREYLEKFQYQPDGTAIFQLWDAMHLFGPKLYNGNTTQPFVDNTIEILKES
jgi:hypothetical protein